MDITGRKSENQQIETIDDKELFRCAFESANDGVCIVSLDGHLLRVNQRMSDIFGYRVEELEGMSVNDITLPDDRAISPTFIQKQPLRTACARNAAKSISRVWRGILTLRSPPDRHPPVGPGMKTVEFL
jgi:PAS domain-containing protein